MVDSTIPAPVWPSLASPRSTASEHGDHGINHLAAHDDELEGHGLGAVARAVARGQAGAVGAGPERRAPGPTAECGAVGACMRAGTGQREQRHGPCAVALESAARLHAARAAA